MRLFFLYFVFIVYEGLFPFFPKPSLPSHVFLIHQVPSECLLPTSLSKRGRLVSGLGDSVVSLTMRADRPRVGCLRAPRAIRRVMVKNSFSHPPPLRSLISERNPLFLSIARVSLCPLLAGPYPYTGRRCFNRGVSNRSKDPIH